MFIPLLSGSNSAVAANPGGSAMNTLAALRNLPDSSNSEATHLEGEARTALTNRDLQTAVSSLYRAVGADPKFTRAWLELGQILFTQMQKDAALEAFHNAIVSDPDEPPFPRRLGTA